MLIEHPTVYLAVLSTENVQHKVEQAGWAGIKEEYYNSMAYAGLTELKDMKVGRSILEINVKVYFF